jgi:hypothetical protein
MLDITGEQLEAAYDKAPSIEWIAEQTWPLGGWEPFFKYMAVNLEPAVLAVRRDEHSRTCDICSLPGHGDPPAWCARWEELQGPKFTGGK